MKAQNFFGLRLIAHNGWFLTNWVISIITALLLNLLWITTSLAEVSIPPEVMDEIQQNGTVSLIVGLDISWKPEGQAKTPAAEKRIKKQREFIKLAQDEFEQRISQNLLTGKSNTPTLRKKDSQPQYFKLKKFTTTPTLAMEGVDSTMLSYLQKMSGIKRIELDTPDEIFLNESVPLIGAEAAKQSGYTGEGQTVVILDTGVDKTHPKLAGKVIKELCFSQKCPNGSSQQEGDGAASPCSFSVNCDHGTHVAGIVTGVATGTKVIAAQIFSNYYSMPASYTSDQIAALEWVYLNYDSVDPPIAAINMSLGGGQYSAVCDNDSRTAIIKNLRAVGVATMVASGNSGYTNAMSAPACISSAISVGATDKSDNVAYFSNSASFLDVLAPGVDILSTIPGGQMGYKSGTSMATPHVAGAWAILRSMYPTATIDSLLTDLKNKGVPIVDSRNNITKSRIDLVKFLSSQEYPLTINPSSNGTVNSSDGIITCGSNGNNCVADYSSGQVVTLQAVADTGFVFENWKSDCFSTTNSLTVTMNAAKTCAATFTPVYSLTITQPSNGKVTSQDGNVNCGTQCSTSYFSGQTVILTAQANTGYQFQQWEGDCTGTTNPLTVTMNTAETCTATFTRIYSLTITSPSNGKVTSQDGNIDCGTRCITSYSSGQTVTLTAQADAGYQFSKWGGNCSGTTNPLTVTMTANKKCTATIVPIYALTIDPPSNGKVTTSDSKISCGSSCSNTYLSGQTATLKAAANSGYQFIQWGGDCSGITTPFALTMNSAKTCNATFYIADTPLTVSKVGGSASGIIQAKLGGTVSFTCGTSCTKSTKKYAVGTQVQLTATASTDYQFIQWGGDCSGTASPITVTMASAKSCTATFGLISAQTYPLTVALAGDGQVSSANGQISCGNGNSDCVANYLDGQAATLQASATPGNQFKQWSNDCSGTANPLTLTIDNAKTCTATFQNTSSGNTTVSLKINKAGGGLGYVKAYLAGQLDFNCKPTCPDYTKDYPTGTQIELLAYKSGTDSTWGGWSGDCSGKTNKILVTLDTATNCTAHFNTTTTTYPLTVSLTGNGTVSSSDGTIDCPSGSCVANYLSTQTITLQATANTNNQFKQWGGDCSGTATAITLKMSTPKVCTAIFEPTSNPTVSLNINKIGSGLGHVKAYLAGQLDFNCKPTCSNYKKNYPVGTQLELLAYKATTDYTWGGWSGDCSSSKNKTTITLDADKTCTARFNLAAQ